MAVLRTVVHETIAPGAGLAVDRALLDRARADGTPRLLVFAWPGDVLALGRYHAAPAGAGGAIHRRRSGGRAFPGGDGFAGVSLALPHRSALESAEPHALRADQAMNRAVRGVLGALALLGVDAHYPGRDLVTAGGKPIGWLSLAVEDDGATLFEAGIALGRDLALLPRLADRVDAGGVVPVTMWLPDGVTSVARVRGGASPSVAETAAALEEGFRRRLGCEIVRESGLEALALPPVTVGFDIPPRLDRRGERATMLGALRAYCRLAGDGTLAEVRLSGDLIAPAATVTAIERALAGVPPARAAVVARVAPLLDGGGEHFLLGAAAEDVAEALVQAASR
jgi:lipoate-protein ligase A